MATNQIFKNTIESLDALITIFKKNNNFDGYVIINELVKKIIKIINLNPDLHKILSIKNTCKVIMNSSEYINSNNICTLTDCTNEIIYQCFPDMILNIIKSVILETNKEINYLYTLINSENINIKLDFKCINIRLTKYTEEYQRNFEIIKFIKIKKDIGETKPKESKPKETKPKESKPKETKPKETKPKETKPKSEILQKISEAKINNDANNLNIPTSDENSEIDSDFEETKPKKIKPSKSEILQNISQAKIISDTNNLKIDSDENSDSDSDSEKKSIVAMNNHLSNCNNLKDLSDSEDSE